MKLEIHFPDSDLPFTELVQAAALADSDTMLVATTLQAAVLRISAWAGERWFVERNRDTVKLYRRTTQMDRKGKRIVAIHHPIEAKPIATLSVGAFEPFAAMVNCNCFGPRRGRVLRVTPNRVMVRIRLKNGRVIVKWINRDRAKGHNIAANDPLAITGQS